MLELFISRQKVTLIINTNIRLNVKQDTMQNTQRPYFQNIKSKYQPFLQNLSPLDVVATL